MYDEVHKHTYAHMHTYQKSKTQVLSQNPQHTQHIESSEAQIGESEEYHTFKFLVLNRNTCVNIKEKIKQ